jgi:hypothetical protein
MEWLDRTVALGYRNADELRIESALDPLRARALPAADDGPALPRRPIRSGRSPRVIHTTAKSLA